MSDQVLDTATPADPIHAFIAQTVAEHPVVLFMKGTPDAPRCGFSSHAVQILDHIGASFIGVDVLQDDGLRDGAYLRSWMTGRFRTLLGGQTVPWIELTGSPAERCRVALEVVDACAAQAWQFAKPL